MRKERKLEACAAWLIEAHSDSSANEVCESAIEAAWNGYQRVYLVATPGMDLNSMAKLLRAVRSVVSGRSVEVAAVEIRREL
jgi:hypothetical protein